MADLLQQGLKIAALFESIINSLPTPVFVKDKKHRLLLVNDAFCELMERKRGELLGQIDYHLLNHEAAEVCRLKDEEAFASHEAIVNQEAFTTSDGVNLTLQVRKMVFQDDNLGSVLCGVITDITELKHYELQLNDANEKLKLILADRTHELANVNEKLLWMANFDPVTELMNKSALTEAALSYIQRADSSGGKFAMVFLDLDDFKFINESYGHPVGDALIKAVGNRLVKVIKERGEVARVGGDEFMLLVSYQDKAEIESITKNIIRILKEPFDSNQHRVFINASIGIASYPEDGSDVITLAQHADAAMYVAKKNNRGGHQFYQEAYTMTIKRKLEMDVYLRDAIKSKELEVHFQPIFKAQDQSIIGYEALARWNDKIFGSVSPTEFIAIAEESDLILPLGELVIDHAVQFIEQQCQKGEYVSINVSPKQLMHPSFKSYLIKQLKHTSMDPKQLAIEVTENVMVKMNEYITQLIQQDELQGIRFFVDDFGTGYSNLSQLKKIQFNALKIDRSFVKELPHSKTDISLVKVMVLMAKELNLEVIAEGVETQQQMACLAELGCQYIQGFLLGRPAKAKRQ
ncbi:sensor domain-containing protein [Marinicella litoralis]|uniref:PAS domain S-box-containing protein/diguanylate cyclase (GGDEF)-like protein n=1 Tax=Marinicella litoralis TaxID=644220 RepID=A0A4R6XUS3_9GAMM|nr:EAL domain-containing protein [Marinicella litoralis]TDR23586.1 PAS domain S-box-containing protein/diguanylate cyclase (GGDEF)-like protein [Marinicella litoralis]